VTGRCTPQWVTTASAPSTLVGRSRAAYAWTGTRLFIWGGQNASGTSVNTGALYDPQTDTWTELPVTAQTPGARVLATAVWTGQEVIVWGGGNASGTNNVNTGSRYDPVTNTWRAMTTSSAPSPRRAPVGVWTGSRALFWGGIQAGGEPHDGTDLYDPIGDAWSKASNNLPGALLDAATGWSGTDFFVFGGQTAIGGTPNDRLYRYRPATDSWQLLNSGPSRRTGAFGSFDGRYFVIWAGYGGFTTLNELNSGSRYDPTANSWTTLSLTGAPTARASSQRASGWAARISGGKTLFLGGFAERGNANSVQRNGGIYDSTTNVWTTVPAWPSGEARLWAVAVWTGNEFVLWGGNNPTTPTATGERFRP
jgi:N-acetylneuraminic acid mutarotase